MGAQARVLGENDISDEVKNEYEAGQEGGECPKQRKSKCQGSHIKELGLIAMAMVGDRDTENEASNRLFAF